jgi:acetyl-CoA carboxylase biotin carboxyl carrier protein
MKDNDIRKYAELMKELELTGLEITEDNKVIRLERTIPDAKKESVVIAAPEPVKASAPKSIDYISIKSPIVGVFYAASAENAELYVSVGDSVQKGKTLCIIEAMKLMNEITAEDDGVISEICVTNGQIVEYGTELFRIKR